MKKIFSIITTLVILTTGASAFEGFMSGIKDKKADYVGLNRNIYVFSSSGKPLKQYSGNSINIKPSKISGGIKFEVDGKRVMIFNAPVIVEEIR